MVGCWRCCVVVLAMGIRRCLPLKSFPRSYIYKKLRLTSQNLTFTHSQGVLLIALQKRTSVPVSTQDFRIFRTARRAPQVDSSAADPSPSFTPFSELHAVDATCSCSLGSCIIWKNQSIDSLSTGFMKTAKWHVCDILALLQ